MLKGAFKIQKLAWKSNVNRESPECKILKRFYFNNLVDPASSHTLVSKIKPCMSKYKIVHQNCEWLIKSVIIYMRNYGITVVILELIHSPSGCNY